MTDPFARLRRFLRELKRRKVYRVAVGYLVAAFVVLQLAGLADDAFGFPRWFEPMIWVVAGLGLPIAVILAWAFEVTPEGVRRASLAGKESGTPETEGARTRESGSRLRPDSHVGGAARPETLPDGAPDEETGGRPSIAVLPFADMSPEGDQAYFADGLAQELLNALSQA